MWGAVRAMREEGDVAAMVNDVRMPPQSGGVLMLFGLGDALAAIHSAAMTRATTRFEQTCNAEEFFRWYSQLMSFLPEWRHIPTFHSMLNVLFLLPEQAFSPDRITVLLSRFFSHIRYGLGGRAGGVASAHARVCGVPCPAGLVTR